MAGETDFAVEGSCNYAFTLVLKEPDTILRDNVERAMREHGVEFRRGLSGGGNQLRQRYLRRLRGDECEQYPNVNHPTSTGGTWATIPGWKRNKSWRCASF